MRVVARRGLVTMVFALVGVVLAGCAGGSARSTRLEAVEAAATAAAPATTSVRTFDPFDATGRIAVPVARTVRGSCWESSLAVTGPDAFRCFTGNTILDPCLRSSVHARTVACAASPWSTVVRMRLTRALPAPDASTSTRPWALRLANGLRCVASTGTAAFVHGKNLDFDCSRGIAARLVHPPAAISSNTTVVAQYARTRGPRHARTLHRSTVRTIWRA